MASSIARPHVPEEELHAYCDGELSPPQRVEIAEHLLGCLICRSQHAEVQELRAKSATLLAMAMPRSIRGFELPAKVSQRRRQLQFPRLAAAAAVAALGVAMWASLLPDHDTTQLASSMAAPAFLGHRDSGLDAAALHVHELEIAKHSAATPQVVASAIAPAATISATGVKAGEDVDPVVASDWNRSDWNAAFKAGAGSLAHVAGLSVASVRMHASVSGGRPTFMIRQQLADGRAIWVFEGPEADVTPVDQLLQASGISMSMPARTKPDYVPADGQVGRTRRMVTVVGYLPVDSLNALMDKVTLH